MTPEDIVAKLAHSLDNFEPINGHLSESDLTRLREAVTPLLLQIPYDETRVVHNLISLIWPKTAYISLCGKEFPKTTSVGAYDTNIDDNAMAVICARSKAAHKAKRADRATYETAQWETTQFVLAVVADTWVREL